MTIKDLLINDKLMMYDIMFLNINNFVLSAIQDMCFINKLFLFAYEDNYR